MSAIGKFQFRLSDNYSIRTERITSDKHTIGQDMGSQHTVMHVLVVVILLSWSFSCSALRYPSSLALSADPIALFILSGSLPWTRRRERSAGGIRHCRGSRPIKAEITLGAGRRPANADRGSPGSPADPEIPPPYPFLRRLLPDNIGAR